jgi:malate dehydrogenase (oxaloacetate-decarboxylating)
VRPLPSPFDAIVAGRPAPVHLRRSALLGARLLTKELAFPHDERDDFGLRGLLPDRVLTIEEQVELEIEHLRRKGDDLERYIGLAALQDRNATLFYRLLAEHLEELLPVVYTPTVGLACQQFSHIIRRTRGIWITPEDIGRVPEVLAAAPYDDVRLIVATDNERILGLGDQGAGGMAIPIGKLALYSAAGGIHPALTLPVSLDVGTDSPALLADPLYLGHRAPRLRGPAYDALVDAFVAGVQEVWPGCLIQWEDFKGANAERILDRFRDRVPSFNDDIQGTAAVVVAGLLAAARTLDTDLSRMRVVLAGAGAAGTGIGRLLRLAAESGDSSGTGAPTIVALDSRGLVHEGRADLDPGKRELALPLESVRAFGLADVARRRHGLIDLVQLLRPDVLVGASGQPGLFDEPVVRALAAGVARPVVMALSNPSSRSEAQPADVLRWSGGRAIVATGSPFPPVTWEGQDRQVGQANNVFVFPGLGLGAVVAEARRVTDGMFLAAARTLASLVDDRRLASGALYPPVRDLARISRAVAIAVAREALVGGVADIDPATDLEMATADATWTPAYVRYLPTERLPAGREGPGAAAGVAAREATPISP